MLDHVSDLRPNQFSLRAALKVSYFDIFNKLISIQKIFWKIFQMFIAIPWKWPTECFKTDSHCNPMCPAVQSACYRRPDRFIWQVTDPVPEAKAIKVGCQGVWCITRSPASRDVTPVLLQRDRTTARRGFVHLDDLAQKDHVEEDVHLSQALIARPAATTAPQQRRSPQQPPPHSAVGHVPQQWLPRPPKSSAGASCWKTR